MDFSWIEKSAKRVHDDETKTFYATIGQEESKEPDLTFKQEVIQSSAKASIKVGASDPGRQRDSFGFVGVKYVYPQILVTGAQRWLGHTYLTVEEKIAQIHTKFKFDYQIVEVNNTGIHVYEVLKYVKGLPVIGVNTSKNLSQDPKKNLDPFKFPVMDKNDMARWMYAQKEMDNILFPKELTKELKELETQVSNIIEYKPEGVGTGNVRYIPEGQEHDDLFMALMLDCWFIREHLMNPVSSQPPVGAGYSFTKAQADELISPNDRIIETIKKQMGNDLSITDVNVEFF